MCFTTTSQRARARMSEQAKAKQKKIICELEQIDPVRNCFKTDQEIMSNEGLYNEYKSYTKTFVSWLVDTGRSVHPPSKEWPQTLTSLLHRTKEIAKCTDIPQKQKSHLSHALFAGMKAIELREAQSIFYRDVLSGKDDEGHAYCIQVLKQAHKMLNEWWKSHRPPKQAKSSHVKEEDEDDNVYDALYEDMSDDEESLVDDVEELNLQDQPTSRPASKKKRLGHLTVDQIEEQIGACRVKAAFLLLEMRVCFDKAISLWEDVSNEEDSEFIASSITSVSIRLFCTLSLQLEVLFPEVKCVDDIPLPMFANKQKAIMSGAESEQTVVDENTAEYQENVKHQEDEFLEQLLDAKSIAEFVLLLLQDIEDTNAVAKMISIRDSLHQHTLSFTFFESYPNSIWEDAKYRRDYIVKILSLFATIFIEDAKLMSSDRVPKTYGHHKVTEDLLDAARNDEFKSIFKSFLKTRKITLPLLLTMMVILKTMRVMHCNPEQRMIGRTIYLCRTVRWRQAILLDESDSHLACIVGGTQRIVRDVDGAITSRHIYPNEKLVPPPPPEKVRGEGSVEAFMNRAPDGSQDGEPKHRFVTFRQGSYREAPGLFFLNPLFAAKDAMQAVLENAALFLRPNAPYDQTNVFKEVCLLYHALCQEGHVKRGKVRFLELLEQIFGAETFWKTPQRPKRGQYMKSFANLKKMPIGIVAAAMNPDRKVRFARNPKEYDERHAFRYGYRKQNIKGRYKDDNKKVQGVIAGEIFEKYPSCESLSILHHNDYSSLYGGVGERSAPSDVGSVNTQTVSVTNKNGESSSWSTIELLESAQEIIFHDLFDSKILSIDLLKLHVTCYKMLESCCYYVPKLGKLFKQTYRDIKQKQIDLFFLTGQIFGGLGNTGNEQSKGKKKSSTVSNKQRRTLTKEEEMKLEGQAYVMTSQMTVFNELLSAMDSGKYENEYIKPVVQALRNEFFANFEWEDELRVISSPDKSVIECVFHSHPCFPVGSEKGNNVVYTNPRNVNGHDIGGAIDHVWELLSNLCEEFNEEFVAKRDRIRLYETVVKYFVWERPELVRFINIGCIEDERATGEYDYPVRDYVNSNLIRGAFSTLLDFAIVLDLELAEFIVNMGGVILRNDILVEGSIDDNTNESDHDSEEESDKTIQSDNNENESEIVEDINDTNNSNEEGECEDEQDNSEVLSDCPTKPSERRPVQFPTYDITNLTGSTGYRRSATLSHLQVAVLNPLQDMIVPTVFAWTQGADKDYVNPQVGNSSLHYGA